MYSLKAQIMYVVFFACLYQVNRWYRQPKIPDHLLGHRTRFIPNLLSKKTADELMELIKEMKDFPSNANELEFYKMAYEHIGEAVPINKDGTCNHAFLIPNSDKTLCVLPLRIDVARHFMKYGGHEGIKEPFHMASSRVQSFGRYMFDLEKHQIAKDLFNSDEFLEEARKVCPEHKQVLDPFQFNFIMQVPGQSVALHLDGVYFTMATRFQYPQWLLAVMKTSGLWENEFIDQIQAVAYVHKWSDPSRGGQFIYYPNNELKPQYEVALSRAGSVVDGSKVIHAATIYQPHMRPPTLNTSNDNRLVYKGKDEWQVTSNGKPVAQYKTDDLRMTIVFRARCFETEEKRKEFNSWYRSGENVLHVDEILTKLEDDMVENKGYTHDYLSSLSKFDLAILLLDEYIAYPVPPHSIIPINYCLLDKLVPWTAPFLSYVCPK